MNITERLISLQDFDYKNFHQRLLPTIDPALIIGVRIPELRKIAKEVFGTEEGERFLDQLPHEFYDENTLHSILISMIKDPERCAERLDEFLPFVDNWTTCDVISPKAFKKQPTILPKKIQTWIHSDHPYTVRFGIGMLMKFYLDDKFQPEYLEWVASVQSDEYYVQMMIAWYFATALAKQPAAALPYLEKERLNPWVHNKTIQKACESDRVSPEMKETLKGLKI